MNLKLFTIWLPISIVIHIIVLLLMSAVTLAKKPAVPGLGRIIPAYRYDPVPIPTPEHTQSNEVPEMPKPTPDNNNKPNIAKTTNKPNATKANPNKTATNNDPSGGAGPKNPNKNVPDGANGTNPNGGRTPGATPSITTSTAGRNTVRQDEISGRGTGGSSPNENASPGRGGGETRGARVSNIKSPVVSKDAENVQFTGVIDVIITIEANGKISSARLGTRKSNIDSLNNAAVSAARNSSGIQVKMIDGSAVQGTTTITYNFSNGKLVGKSN